MEALKVIGLFFKIPEKGKVKTRLAKTIGNSLATFVYKYLLKKSIKSAESLEDISLFAFYLGNPQPKELKAFNFNKGWKFFPQIGKDLGIKLKNASELLFDLGYQEILLIGADCPYLDKRYLLLAFNKLKDYPLVIGPALDGGYVLLGIHRSFRENLDLLFLNLPFETSKLLNKTVERLPQGHYYLLPPLRDVDTLKDLIHFFLSPFDLLK